MSVADENTSSSHVFFFFLTQHDIRKFACTGVAKTYYKHVSSQWLPLEEYDSQSKASRGKGKGKRQEQPVRGRRVVRGGGGVLLMSYFFCLGFCFFFWFPACLFCFLSSAVFRQTVDEFGVLLYCFFVFVCFFCRKKMFAVSLHFVSTGTVL